MLFLEKTKTDFFWISRHFQAEIPYSIDMATLKMCSSIHIGHKINSNIYLNVPLKKWREALHGFYKNKFIWFSRIGTCSCDLPMWHDMAKCQRFKRVKRFKRFKLASLKVRASFYQFYTYVFAISNVSCSSLYRCPVKLHNSLLFRSAILHGSSMIYFYWYA